jgi:hypothetical protein
MSTRPREDPFTPPKSGICVKRHEKEFDDTKLLPDTYMSAPAPSTASDGDTVIMLSVARNGKRIELSAQSAPPLSDTRMRASKGCNESDGGVRAHNAVELKNPAEGLSKSSKRTRRKPVSRGRKKLLPKRVTLVLYLTGVVSGDTPEIEIGA